MSGMRPLVELFVATEAMLGSVEPTWWGAVVTDPRYPVIWDVNYARVERSHADLTLEEIEAALLPALGDSRATHEHVVLFEPDGMADLLGRLERRGDRISWDTVMEHTAESEAQDAADTPPHAVEEVTRTDGLFWTLQRQAFVEFEVTDEVALDQLVAWERDVLLPFGKRWFAVRMQGEMAGFGALVVHDGTAYLDNVVTLPHARERGIAAAVVRHIVEAAYGAGASRVFLLADQPGPIRLYGRLGFREVGRIASSLRPITPS